MRKFGVLKKAVAGLLVVTMCVGSFVFDGTHNAEAEDSVVQNIPENPVYDENTDTTEWSYVYFGSYPQTQLLDSEVTEEIENAEYNEDGDAVVDGQKIRRMSKKDATYTSKYIADGFYNWGKVGKGYVYFRYEPIKWRVLQNEGDTLLLLADTVLDCQRYERTDGKITWATCSIRNWLNGYSEYMNVGWDFYTTGFSKEEQQAIVTSNLTNPKNPFHGTNGGSDTSDKVFLLSIPEITNEEYGFPSDYMTYSSTRQLKATDYAKAMGVWMGTHNDLYSGNAIWMLRSPGSYQQTVSLVYWFGHVYQDGYYAQRQYYGVAPAIRVSTASDLWTMADLSEEDLNINLESDLSIMDETLNIQKLSAKSDVIYVLDDVLAALKCAVGIIDTTDNDLIKFDLDNDGVIVLNEVYDILCMALGIEVPDTTEKPQETPLVTKEPQQSDFPQETDSPQQSDSPQETFSPSVSFTPFPSEPVPTLVPSEAPTTEPPLVQKDVEASGNIWIAGDSIAAYHSKGGYTQPLYGWGELIGNYFNNNKNYTLTNSLSTDKRQKEKILSGGEYDSVIFNAALSSRSSKSYTNENNYSSIIDLMGEGDYLLISFGHNDERADVDLYTDPFGTSSDERSFKWFLKKYYIDPAIRAGVQPVLISPVTRRYFYNEKFVNPQLHTTYGKAMKELSEEYEAMGITVYYIDLHSYMLDMYEELGENGTVALHGKYNNTMDNTHLSEVGATKVCDFIIEKMTEQNMSITKFIKNEYKQSIN